MHFFQRLHIQINLIINLQCEPKSNNVLVETHLKGKNGTEHF